MKKLYGIVAPIITPFDTHNQVDLPSLERLSEYIVQSGIHCIYPCGTTGEFFLLSIEERERIAQVVTQTVAGRIPVYVMAGAATQEETIRLAQHAVACGADGIGVMTPIFYKLSDRETVDYFVAVANSVPADFPVYLYAIPQNAVNDITVEAAQQIAERCKNVVGVKYSYPDMTRLQQLMMVRNQDFSVLVGPDHLFQAVVAVGGAGTVSGNAMIVPEHYVALWDAMQSGDSARAIRLQRRTNVLNATLCKMNNIAAYKIMLKEKGIIEHAVTRAPMEQLTREDAQWLINRMEELDYTRVPQA